MEPVFETASPTAPCPLVLMRFRPAWSYIEGVRDFGRFFCQAAFGTELVAERATVIIQETLENAVKYSRAGVHSELELRICAEGERIVFSVSSLPDPDHAQRLREELSSLQSLDPEQAYLAAFVRAAREPSAGSRMGLARVRYEGDVELSLTDEAGGRIRVTAIGKL